MSSKREIGSKFLKRIFPLILAPSVSSKTIKDNIQFIKEDESRSSSLLYDKNHQIRFFKYENQYLPTIQFIRENPSIDLPLVKVDQGAVPHILNGANIYNQGITFVDRVFRANTIIMIANPQNAILALGKALITSSELIDSKGKGIINIHYLGDKLWENKL
ncbi:MAG: PUA domain-containing protein [Candidatus Hodarchaeota archaeon]